MTEADRDQFNEKFVEICDLFSKEPVKKTIDLYFRLLEEYDIETVLIGMDVAMRTCKFFPKPAEIVEVIDGKENEIIDFSYQEAKALFYDGFHFAKRLKNVITMQVISDMGGQQEFYNRVYVNGENDTAAYFEFKRIFKKYYRLYRAGLFMPSISYLPGYMDKLPGAAPVAWESLPALAHGSSTVRIGKKNEPEQITAGA